MALIFLYDMKKLSHSFIIYYEPTTRTWKAYWKQISDGGMPRWIADKVLGLG